MWTSKNHLAGYGRRYKYKHHNLCRLSCLMVSTQQTGGAIQARIRDGIAEVGKLGWARPKVWARRNTAVMA